MHQAKNVFLRRNAADQITFTYTRSFNVLLLSYPSCGNENKMNNKGNSVSHFTRNRGRTLCHLQNDETLTYSMDITI